MCWIDIKLNGHYPCLDFSLWLLIVQSNKKMCYPIVHTSCLNRGMLLTINNVTPFSNLKNLQFQKWLKIPKNKTFLQRIREDLINDSFIVVVKSHRKNLLSDFNKFEFRDGLLYHDELLYVPKELTWFQVLKAKHDTLVAGHFGFNKTMELMFHDYWWS